MRADGKYTVGCEWSSLELLLLLHIMSCRCFEEQKIASAAPKFPG
jgi:hypothetical protein